MRRAHPRAQPEFIAIPSLVENMKCIYMVTKYTNTNYIYDHSNPRVAHIGVRVPLEEAERAEQHIHHHRGGAKRAVKLGGAQSDESWPSARRWRQGMFVRRRLRKPPRSYVRSFLRACGHTFFEHPKPLETELLEEMIITFGLQHRHPS